MKLAVLTLGDYATNCYLVWDETSRDCAVIDPGYDDPAILDTIRTEQLTLRAVLLTHGHFDHVGGVAALRAAGAEVWLCRDDLSLPDGLTTLDPRAEYHFYDEGDTVAAGPLRFTVLHTPGHTPGSVCLLIGDLLLCGDTLFAGSCGRTDLAGGDEAQMFASLRRLSQLPDGLHVLPGHGPASTMAREKQGNPYLRMAVAQ